MSENKHPLAWFLLLLLALIWGSSFILIKRGLDVFSPGEVGAIRILSASIFLLPLSLTKLRALKIRHWKLLAVVGFSGSFIPAFLFANAQTNLDSSIAGVLNALTPMFTMILGATFFQQKMTMKVTVGLILGFFGSALLIMAGAGGSFASINFFAFFVVAATIFYAVNLNIIKFHISDLSAEVITAVSLLLVGPLAGIYLFGTTNFVHNLQHIEGAYLSLGYLCILGIVGTALALILFNHLVKITSPIFTSSVTYIIPIIAVGWGLLDGEVLFFGHYAGMLLILFGVYLINRR